jgi:peptide/nickel transport system substrate-binding protein/oligopeptide transport system substrate-binding protein
MRRLLPAALALLVAAGGCERPQPDIAGAAVLRYRLMDDPPDMDPVRAHDNASEAVLFEVFDGLVEFDPATLRIVPAVAASWEISGDGRRYTFHLREGARFHNGRAVEAADVVWSFERSLRPEAVNARPWVLAPVLGAAAFRAGETDRVEGLEAVDPRTVRVTLVEPFAPFLSHLVLEQASILPREVYEDPREGYLDHPVGCGPFRMGEWRRGQVLVLHAFADYYGDGPHVDRLEFRIIRDQETALQEFRAGNLEITDEIPSGSRRALREEFGDQYRQWPQIAVRGIAFNHARPPFAGNPALRRALSHAVDRDYLIRVIDEGKDRPVAGIIPPGLDAHDPGLAGYPYDPDRARQLLAEAGYPDGRGLPEITILYNTNEGHRRMLERIASDLAQVGVRAVPRPIDLGAYLTAIAGTPDEPPQAEMFYFAWVADFPDAYNFLYVNLHTDNLGPGTNFARYANPELDRLVDEAVRETDPDRRGDLYRRAERLAVDDAAWIFLYSFQDEALVRPEVQGLVLSPLGDFAIPLNRARLVSPAIARTGP